MTAPSDPKDAAESLLEEQEIVLRLGDILPRVPAHLLKPGPHDTTPEIRFSVEELAEKISRGRVTVPLRRLSSVCPTVFRDSSAFPGEQEVPLPLQKLLEQVGLVVPKAAAANGIPGDQLSQARSEAARIIESSSSAIPVEPDPPPADPPPREPSPAPTGIPSPISKAISTARHLLGLLGLQGDSPVTAAKAADVTAPESSSSQPAASTPAETPNPVETSPAPPASAPPEATNPTPPGTVQAAPEGCISLRLLPIFRLLSPPVLRTGAIPSDEACVVLPLSIIDPQLPAGHVEIPVEDFVKGLPEDLRDMIDPIPGTQIWIPLDEIFQNLPKAHLFYMPPFDPLAYSEAAPVEDLPPTEPVKDLPPAEPAPEAKETAPAAAEPEKAAEPPPDIVDKSEAPPADPVPDPAEDKETAPVAEASPSPAPPEDATPVEPPTPAAEPALPEPVAAPIPAEPPPSRAPWMRGFQVPPPRLFANAAAPAEAAVPPAEPPPLPSPSTPEARRTADFLATQTGIFAAAAFVEGAVFASADFPRKPDLDTLREFMGLFIHQASGSAQRLGWNRVLTIPCEQFHLTAVVRDTHFIVALHHDRVLAPLTYDAVIAAADELGKGSVS